MRRRTCRRGAPLRAALLAALVVAVPMLVNSAPAAADAFGPQFQVSFNGGTGDPTGTGQKPDIAYNSRHDEHLVVWVATGNGTVAIYGQRIDENGTAISGPFKISDNSTTKAQSLNEPPTVTYNPVADEYLVAWGALPTGAGEDVYVQRVATDGTLLLPADELISDTGTYGDLETQEPVYSPDSNEYFVVWKADGSTGGQQIYGQRLAADGSQIGSDIQISQMTNQADDAVSLAYNSREHEYLAVWRGQQTGGEDEIYGQRLSLTGAEIGTNDFQISDMTTNGNANPPRVAYNSRDDQYLVAWTGNFGSGNDQVYTQLLDASGGKIGAQAPISDDTVEAFRPDIAHNPNSDEYFVSWHNGNNEVHGQYLSAAGAETGTNDFLISQNPPDIFARPSVDYNSATCDYTAVYMGGTLGQPPAAATRGIPFTSLDVFGRRVGAAPCMADLAVTKTGAAQVQFGSNVTYTITVTSNGPSDALGVQLTDAVPAGTKFVSASSPQGACTGTTSVSCNLGNLAVGASATVAVVVHPTAVGTVSNTATVAGSRQDQNAANNSATASTKVVDTVRPRVSVAGVRTCVKRTMTVRIRIRDLSALRFARVYLNGKRIKSTKRKSFSVKISARRAHRKTNRIKVVARDTSGNTRTVTRAFAKCAVRHIAPRFTG
jgi:uncharacterized repeat protein (TIGR01451 family)